MRLNLMAIIVVGLLVPVGCYSQGSTVQTQQAKAGVPLEEKSDPKDETMEKATFGGGCFWCVESVFLQLEGVESVKSGYMGGEVAIKGNGGTTYSLAAASTIRRHPISVFLNGKKLASKTDYSLGRQELEMTMPVQATDDFYVVVDNPTYEQVCTATSGHAEVIQVVFDPAKVSFDVLLQVFWKTHDPTTLNRQGNDVGPQYRSAVFYHSDAQKDLAENYKKKLNEVKAYPRPIITEITKATRFYEAEDYHQDYFNKNPTSSYCQMLIPAKLEKLKKVFGDKLKKN